MDLEKENTKKQPNFDLRVGVFSDISDEELVKASQDIEEKENTERFPQLNQKDLDKLVKKGLSKKKKNPEQKSKWARSFMVKRMRKLNVTEMQRKQKPWIYVIPLCVHLVHIKF